MEGFRLKRSGLDLLDVRSDLCTEEQNVSSCLETRNDGFLPFGNPYLDDHSSAFMTRAFGSKLGHWGNGPIVNHEVDLRQHEWLGQSSLGCLNRAFSTHIRHAQSSAVQPE